MAHYLVPREVRAETQETVEHRECKTGQPDGSVSVNGGHLANVIC